jgi:hypothetical protein
MIDKAEKVANSKAKHGKERFITSFEIIMTLAAVYLIPVSFIVVLLNMDGLHFLLILAGTPDTSKLYYIIIRGVCVSIAYFEGFVTTGGIHLCNIYFFQFIESCLISLKTLGPRHPGKINAALKTSQFSSRLQSIHYRDDLAVYRSIRYLLHVAREQIDFLIAVSMGVGLCFSVVANYCVIKLHGEIR